jgi:hypothetical protein
MSRGSPNNRYEARAKALEAAEVSIAGILVNLSLSTEVRIFRYNGETV